MIAEAKRLSEKYRLQFLNVDKNKEYKSDINGILEQEKLYNKDCVDWTTEELEGFLRNLNSVSPNTISKVYSIYKSFVEFISNKEELPIIEHKIEHGRICELINYDRLLNTLVSPQQYKFIVNQLDRNVRDKVIMELAWIGLGLDEIRNIKEKHIEFIESQESGLPMAIIKIFEDDVFKGKVFKVEDVGVVEDIKKCMNEHYYYIETKDGKSKRMMFKSSDYLIKPVQVGVSSKKEDNLATLSSTLQKSIEQQGVTCEGINVSELTIESIRRSKIIYMLAPQNEKYFDKDFIKMVFDMEGSDSTLFWYQKVAKIKYPQ